MTVLMSLLPPLSAKLKNNILKIKFEIMKNLIAIPLFSIFFFFSVFTVHVCVIQPSVWHLFTFIETLLCWFISLFLYSLQIYQRIWTKATFTSFIMIFVIHTYIAVLLLWHVIKYILIKYQRQTKHTHTHHHHNNHLLRTHLWI